MLRRYLESLRMIRNCFIVEHRSFIQAGFTKKASHRAVIGDIFRCPKIIEFNFLIFPIRTMPSANEENARQNCCNTNHRKSTVNN